MRLDSKCPWLVLGTVLAWRCLLLLGTAQPVPANDAFLFDGAVVNWLLQGQYFNPSLAECFPISGHQVFSAYPPIYQGLLLPWMSMFGTSALSAMWFHLFWFGVAGLLLAGMLRLAFPKTVPVGLAVLFLFAVTFDDRPEGLAHVFGLAALWLTVAKFEAKVKRAVAQTGIVLALFCSLYTSVVVGAFYSGITIVTGFVAWLKARRPLPWAVSIGVVALFAGVTLWVSEAHPLWWQGFLENARQTPVSTTGFRLPQSVEVIKVIRNAPVFLLALVCAPWLWRNGRGTGAERLGNRGREQSTRDAGQRKVDCGPWTAEDPAFSLTIAVAAVGLVLVVGTLALFTANYVIYLWYAQVLLAAGLATWAAGLQPRMRQLVQAGLIGSLLLVSVRAVGMTTWGVFCAQDVSYARAENIVRQELQPLVESGARPVVSSAFLYQAARLGVRGAIHADWPYDRRQQPPGSDLAFMQRLRPPKLVLTQFDFYRVYAPIIQELQRDPELGSVQVRNAARAATPDSFASLQRVLQHVSWAPVIVEIEWK